MRHLILILGDQLDFESAAFDDFDPQQDRVLMIEAPSESRHVPSHKARTVLFLSAMRHFAHTLAARGIPLDYLALGKHPHPDLQSALIDAIKRLRPQKLVCVEPGEWRVLEFIKTVARQTEIALGIRPDRHFLCTREQFAQWAGRGKQLRMEMFYRRMRRETGVLMQGDQPEGGEWNFDADNRGSFGKKGPGLVPPPLSFAPDALTREAIEEVERLLPDNPGSTAHFDWPVTREDSLLALQDFIDHRLSLFGRYQDAMWTGEPWLYHARISAALNLKLLRPMEAIDAALACYRAGRAPISAVEGFIRQILGWREFIRGVYWLDMPGLKTANHYQHQRPLPAWYWTGRTGMNCMAQAIGQTLEYGYAHHIQRLMVTGQFAVLAGINPQEVCDWYLGIYIDAVEWVELPNTAGMALFANGGRFTTKPYIASGKYIERMSNYCRGCRYRPEVRVGDEACPVTTLYWNFLDQHRAELEKNPRAATLLLPLKKMDDTERAMIRDHACKLFDRIDTL